MIVKELAKVSTKEVEECIYLQEQYTSFISLIKILKSNKELADEFGYDNIQIEKTIEKMNNAQNEIGLWWDRICEKYQIFEERNALMLDYTQETIYLMK